MKKPHEHGIAPGSNMHQITCLCGEQFSDWEGEGLEWICLHMGRAVAGFNEHIKFTLFKALEK